VAQSYLQQLGEAIREFLPTHSFNQIPVGQATFWKPQRVTWVALLMAWGEGQTLGARWDQAGEVATKLHPRWRLGESYSGYTQALTRLSVHLIPALVKRLQVAMKAVAGRYWKSGLWVAFAVDGTRIEAPHTAQNEEGLGCAGRAKTAPQVFLTTVWHLGTGLPWTFRVGPGTDSERNHFRRMIGELPERSMIVADAGFAGYALFLRLLLANHSFLIRVGRNITLLKNLGYYHEERDGLVYLWPRAHRRCRPLVLRLIELTLGSQTVCLLTNVLDENQLGDEEAAALYKQRWGEEVFHRSYKQTMSRRKILSRTPETCQAEASWMVLGLWLLSLITAARIIEAGGDPQEISVAQARDTLRRAMRESRRGKRMAARLREKKRRLRRGRRPVEVPDLWRELADARKDRYERRRSIKASRNYPRKKKEKPPGRPKIRPATPTEVKKSAKLPTPEILYKWTA
jgi:Transposase DDE domain